MSGALSERDAVKLRQARLRAARAYPLWEEIPADLVARGRRWVSASTDQVYKLARGATFETGGHGIAGETPLCFTVDEDGRLKFYEVEPGGPWSERVAAQARRRLKRGKS